MIRITSKIPYAMSVPYLTPRGVQPEFFQIPGMVDGEPGVVELEKLDSQTIARLRWHYDWRPTDPKNADKKRDDLDPDQVADIGLLTIEILDGEPSKERLPKQLKPAKRRPTLNEVKATEGGASAGEA